MKAGVSVPLLLLAAATAVLSGPLAADEHPSKLFLDNCASCHGPDGKAQTEEGKKRGAEVFADAKWQEKKRSKVDKLIRSVEEGRGKKMPGFKDKLSAAEIRGLVEKDVLGAWK